MDQVCAFLEDPVPNFHPDPMILTDPLEEIPELYFFLIKNFTIAIQQKINKIDLLTRGMMKVILITLLYYRFHKTRSYPFSHPTDILTYISEFPVVASFPNFLAERIYACHLQMTKNHQSKFDCLNSLVYNGKEYPSFLDDDESHAPWGWYSIPSNNHPTST